MKRYKYNVEFIANVLANSEEEAMEIIERSIDWNVTVMDLIDEDDVSIDEEIADWINDFRKAGQNAVQEENRD